MRFHHSTRRRRPNASQSRWGPHSSSRLAQLGYCHETNIHFNRRIPVEPPDSVAGSQQHQQLSYFDDTDSGLLLTTSMADSPSQGARNTSQRAQSSRRQSRSPQAGRAPSSSRAHPDQSVSASFQGPALAPAALDMTKVRQMLIAQVDKHPFWSNKAARRMELTSVEERHIYLYELVSFCERRDLEWRFEPYTGRLAGAPVPYRQVGGAASDATSLASDLRRLASMAPAGSGASSALGRLPLSLCTSTAAGVDRITAGCSTAPAMTGIGAGATSVPSSPTKASIQRSISSVSGSQSPASPGAELLTYETLSAIERPEPTPHECWQLEPRAQARPQPFVPHTHSIEVPQSSFVKSCHGCSGRGRLKCNACYGVGYEICLGCSGRGTIKNNPAGVGSSALSPALVSPLSATPRRFRQRDNSAGSAGEPGSPWSEGRECLGALESPASVTASSTASGGGGGGGGGLSSGSVWGVTETCHVCHGAGQKRCWVCAGKSYNNCFGCLGAGKLRCYRSLNITWLNHTDETILNNSDAIIPVDRLRVCSGYVLAEQTANRLEPLAMPHLRLSASAGAEQAGSTKPSSSARPGSSPASPSDLDANQSDSIQAASRKLLEHHQQLYKLERFIKQRHKVTQVNCNVVHYEWKQKRGHFVIYGADECKVYIPKYPFKSICTIA